MRLTFKIYYNDILKEFSRLKYMKEEKKPFEDKDAY